MRLIHYYIINKDTNKAIYVNCRRSACEEKLAGMADKENHFIGFKFVSI